MLKRSFFSLLIILIISASCTVKQENKPLKTGTLSKQDVEQMSPDSIINILKTGNERFAKGDLTSNDYPALVNTSKEGQYPMAVVLACMDSRVPVKTLFDMTIGDLFVVRVAGNIVNEDILGSMEYGCKYAGAKVVVVMGHTGCGAVAAACKGKGDGNITGIVAKIQPAVEKCKSCKDCSKSEENLVDAVAKTNVELTIEDIRAQSEVLNKMEKSGAIKIVGAVYDIATGKVNFL